MASTFITNPPNEVSMATFRAAMDRLGGPAKQCRFAVRILPIGQSQLLSKKMPGGGTNNYGSLLQEMVFLCESVEFPGRGLDFIDARYYGPAIQMPTNSKYAQQADLTFICRTESFERQLFDDWMEIVNPSDTFDFNYIDQYWCEIQIFQLAEYGETNKSGQALTQPVYQWTLLRAYPIQVHPQAVTWADQDVLRLSVTFSYRYWFRPNRDQMATTGTITVPQ